MKLQHGLLSLFVLCLAAAPAVAQNDLYDNGPTNGTNTAWTINFNFVDSDTFSLSQASTVNGLTFAAWLIPGDVLQSAEVSITSNEFGGTIYFDQTVNFTQSGCTLNGMSYFVCNESGTFPGVALNAGTYWLNLQNAVVPSGDPVYWDENSGPSSASNNEVCTIPSESFTVLGSASSTSSTSTSTTSSVPEPSSILLLGSGILGLSGIVRRKLSR